MDTLYTFWDNNTHCKTESLHFLELMNSAVSLELHFRVRIFDSFFNTIPNKTESAQELSQTPEPHRTQILEDWGFRAFGFSGFSLGFRVWLLGF